MRRSRREDGTTARMAAQMESSWCRTMKTPRQFVLAAIETAVREAGYDDETSQREAAAVWRTHWQRPSDNEAQHDNE